jgi:hypothetical protein
LEREDCDGKENGPQARAEKANRCPTELEEEAKNRIVCR